MATLTTGDWQRIGYYNIYNTSTHVTYISLNARINSIDYSNRTAVVGTLLNLDNNSYAYTTDGISAGMTGCTNIAWGRTTFGTGTNTTLLQGGFTVSYDDNGNASCNVQCWVNQTFGGNLSMQTVGCSLQNIGAKVTHTPSQPSINTWPNNSPNITAGVQCYIHCNQGSDSAIRHDVYYTIGSKTEYIKYDFQTNCAWTPSVELCSLFPNATSMSGTVYLKSFVNGSLIGTKSCPFVLSVPSYTPSISIKSITETNSNVSAIVSNETIQGLSTKQVTVSAGTSYYASISGVWCNGVQLSYSNGVYVGTLSNMQTGTYSCSVKDSRGKTNSTASSQTFNYYSKPSITGSASRTSQTGSNGSLTVSGTYSQIKSNTVTVTIARVSGSTDTSTYTGSNSFSKTLSYSDLVYTQEFSWNLTVKDRFNQTTTSTVKLGMGQYALWLGKTGAKTSGDLTVGGNENISGALTVGGKLNANSDISASGLISSSLMVGSSWDFDWLNTGVLLGNNVTNAPFNWSLVISGGTRGTRAQVAYDLWNNNPPKTRYQASGNWSSWKQVNTKNTNSIYRVAEGFANEAVSQNSTITRHRFTEAYTYDSNYFSVVASDKYYYLKCNKSARYIVIMNIKFANVSGTYLSACGITDNNGNATWDLDRCDEFTTIYSGIHSATWMPYITASAPIYYTASSGVTRNVEHCYMMILAVG